jgi:AraC family transcriptional regulator, positive regulator of tynA and feaB
MLLTKVPRRVLLSRLPDAERMTAIRIDGTSPVGRLASEVLRSAVSIDIPQDTASSSRLGASMVDILASAIEMELDTHEDLRNRQAQLLKKAKAFIHAHLDQTDLTIYTIAQTLHVSPRTLNRVFASEGTTVIKWLWNERLQASHAILSEGRATQVIDVVAGCGFTNGSHFSRMFKTAYGVLPHTLLRHPGQPH